LLAKQINWYEEEVRKSVRLALQCKLEIGKRLVQAKELLPHGAFLRWAQNEFGWTARHIQNHLALAANAKQVSLLPAQASFRMALAAIKEVQPESQRTPACVEVLHSPQRIHIIGEAEEGTIDCEQLIAEVARIAINLGASKTRWRTR